MKRTLYSPLTPRHRSSPAGIGLGSGSGSLLLAVICTFSMGLQTIYINETSYMGFSLLFNVSTAYFGSELEVESHC